MLKSHALAYGLMLPAQKNLRLKHPDYSRSHEGTGLGLPLAKSLSELHGGTMKIVSLPGEGTMATVRFPPERTIENEYLLNAAES